MAVPFAIFLVELAAVLLIGQALARDFELRELKPGQLRQIDNVCSQTVPHCELCLDYRTCRRCQKGFKLTESYWGGLCVSSCPEGSVETIMDNRGLVCASPRACPKIPKCAQCEEAFHSICDRCRDGYLLFQRETGSDVQCVKLCPPGFVKHGHMCRAEMCEDFFCTRCKADWVLEYRGATKCLPSCPSGFYKRIDILNDQPYCDSCRTNCQSCRDSLNCDVCKDGFYLHHGVFSKCLRTCPDGTNRSGNICQKDTTGCQDKLCLRCKEGWFQLRTRRFYSCHKACPYGHFGIQEAEKPKRCGRCPFNCDKCSTHRSCQRCKPGFLKFPRGERDYCVLHCPRGNKATFDNNGTKVCRGVSGHATLLGRL